MSDYYKEKLKVDLDLFRNYISILIVLAAGLATLLLKENLWRGEMVYVILFVIGIGIEVFILSLCIGSYSEIKKDLTEIKKQ